LAVVVEDRRHLTIEITIEQTNQQPRRDAVGPGGEPHACPTARSRRGSLRCRRAEFARRGYAPPTSPQPGGLSDPPIAGIDAIVAPLARVAESWAMRRTAGTLLDTYVGPHGMVPSVKKSGVAR